MSWMYYIFINFFCNLLNTKLFHIIASQFQPHLFLKSSLKSSLTNTTPAVATIGNKPSIKKALGTPPASWFSCRCFFIDSKFFVAFSMFLNLCLDPLCLLWGFVPRFRHAMPFTKEYSFWFSFVEVLFWTSNLGQDMLEYREDKVEAHGRAKKNKKNHGRMRRRSKECGCLAGWCCCRNLLFVICELQLAIRKPHARICKMVLFIPCISIYICCLEE